MNCMAFEVDGRILVVDCGVTFPDRAFGLNLAHADLSYLEDRAQDIEALILTHGHEDHIGAVPFLLEAIEGLPVYGPRYAITLCRHRLEEWEDDAPRDTFVEVAPGETLELGPFRVEPIRVTHSIVDATAVAIHTPVGVIVHSGDYKIEEPAPDGDEFDRARFESLGTSGVRLLLADSTNSLREGRTGTEASVRAALTRHIVDAPHRVCVAIFASNIHRLRSLFAIARDAGRRVCLLGRSVRRHVELATETGHLDDVSSLLVHPDDAPDIPRSQLLIIATGTQGEPPAALPRLARQAHPTVRLEAGDHVLLSSRIIPGHELGVFDLINQLERQDIRVVFSRVDPQIHVSGHARRDEQRTLLQLTRPRAFVPLHGTRLHLQSHAQLAREAGVEDIAIIENGDVLELTADDMRVVDRIETGRVIRDGQGDVVTPALLRDRQLLAELGFAAVVVELDRAGRVIGDPSIVTRGFCNEAEERELLPDAQRSVRDAVESAARRDIPTDLGEVAGVALKRFFGRRVGRRPLCRGIVRDPR